MEKLRLLQQPLTITPMLQLNWIFLNKEDITHYLIPEQLNVILPSETDQENNNNHIPTDPLKNIIHDICAYIQNRIPKPLHPNPIALNHLPDACKAAACALVIESLQTRLPALKLSEDQVRNAEQARKSMEELYRYWKDEIKPKPFEPRCEALSYRIRDAKQQTLKGL